MGFFSRSRKAGAEPLKGVLPAPNLDTDELARVGFEDVSDRQAEVAISSPVSLGKTGADSSAPGLDEVSGGQPADPPFAPEVVVRKGKLTRAEQKALKLEAKAAKKKEKEDLKRLKENPLGEADPQEALNSSLSDKVVIEFYPGVAEKEAIDLARHWAMTHMDMPSLCFYYVQKIRNGYAVEIQQGVGQAYLPSVIDLAMKNPNRLVIVPMIRRKLTVFYQDNLGEFEAQILPELQEPPVNPESPPLLARRSKKMTPVLKQHHEWLIVGLSSFAIGAVALLGSLALYAFDPSTKLPPNWRTTKVEQVPVLQWPRLQSSSEDSYVTRLEFVGGEWRIVRQAVSAQVEVGSSDPAQPMSPSPGMVPSGMSVPGSPSVAPMQPNAPAAMQQAPTPSPIPGMTGGR